MFLLFILFPFMICADFSQDDLVLTQSLQHKMSNANQDSDDTSLPNLPTSCSSATQADWCNFQEKLRPRATNMYEKKAKQLDKNLQAKPQKQGLEAFSKAKISVQPIPRYNIEKLSKYTICPFGTLDPEIQAHWILEAAISEQLGWKGRARLQCMKFYKKNRKIQKKFLIKITQRQKTLKNKVKEKLTELTKPVLNIKRPNGFKQQNKKPRLNKNDISAPIQDNYCFIDPQDPLQMSFEEIMQYQQKQHAGQRAAD